MPQLPSTLFRHLIVSLGVLLPISTTYGNQGSREEGWQRGCAVAALRATPLHRSDLKTSLGSAYADRLFGYFSRQLERAFRVKANVYYYDDLDGMNALATSDPALRVIRPDGSTTDGTVAYGSRMLASTVHEDDRPEWTLHTRNMFGLGILAHEFAHILQFKRGTPLTGFRFELQADMLAGWYVHHFFSGRYINLYGDYIGVNVERLYTGFEGIGSRPGPQRSHGTAAERRWAITCGIKLSMWFNESKLPDAKKLDVVFETTTKWLQEYRSGS